MGVYRHFPYSNFHEMNMDEIIKIVKELVEEWSTYHAQWDEWQGNINQAWEDLQNFINNYFDDLDVQVEINNKIASMVNSGQFGTIVAPYIPPSVTEWLSANITQPVGVVIDTSLSVAGACADAKATGDAINELNSELHSIASLNLYTIFDFVNDKYIDASGVETSLTGSGHTDYIPVDENHKYNYSFLADTTAPISSTRVRVHAYDANKNWLEMVYEYAFAHGTNPALPVSLYFNLPQDCAYLIVSFGLVASVNDSVLTDITLGGISAIDNLARENLKKQAYVYKNKTTDFTVDTGQAYGSVGSQITISGSQEYKHVRISKSANIDKVKFSTSYNPNISAYIQYVDDNDIIISKDFVQGSYNISSVYEYLPNFPTGATGMYVSGGWRTPSGYNNVLEVYQITDITVTDIYEVANTKVERDYNEIVKSVNRIADGLTVPQQSIIGYKTAYKLGFRAMLCDLRFTSDGVPVLFHDDYLNQYSNIVYDENGQLVPTTNPIYIDQASYADLLNYDFGLYKGATYANTPILSLDDMLNLCKLLGCEVWLEMKVTPTTSQYDTVFNLISKYGMRDKCYWCPQSTAQISDLIAYNPDVYINYHSNLSSGETMTDAKVNAIVNATTDYNRYKNSITLAKTANITEAQVETLSEAGVGLMTGTMHNASDVTTFYNRGVPYKCATYALCDGDVIAGKILFETIQLP